MRNSTPSILLATSNQNKIRELKAILSPLGLPLVALADLKESWPVPIENGQDFLANALIKARYYAEKSGLAALADDSGLMVKALGGAPGVYSARYGGEKLKGLTKKEYLLQELAGVTDRRAKFKAVLVLAKPDGSSLDWSGELKGEIALELRGTLGFGYDPIFIEPKSGLTLAQMSLEEKNHLSHRARAGEALGRDLEKIIAFLSETA
ncbi:MAG: RdgB/HAM1 family non-canonical purine NTP pyrophosphatase [Deltaproteobacteria bacterium]|jgi:XTP/dITP diphosphohydrolase|nr:RdgB/HAM1 family non-canonical purine NTP pyrophosphatase [Deltaproteobacteria bacterium]